MIPRSEELGLGPFGPWLLGGSPTFRSYEYSDSGCWSKRSGGWWLCFDWWFIHKPDTEGVRYLETELRDGLLGAQISVVKQPYAYFNKELVQQIDASDVGLSTTFFAEAADKRRQLALSMGPPSHPGCSLGKHGLTPHSQSADSRTQGPMWVSAFFPGPKQRVPQAGVACRCQDLGSQHQKEASSSCKVERAQRCLSFLQRFSRTRGKTETFISKAVCHYSGLHC